MSNQLEVLLQSDRRPIAVPIGEEFADSLLLDIANHVEVFEFRADLFTNRDPSYLKDQLDRLRQLAPVILTPRSTSEGGMWQPEDGSRVELVEKLTDHCDGMDTEIKSPEARNISEVAHQAGKVSIGSYHNFKRTPSKNFLNSCLQDAESLEFDYTKLALQLVNFKDYLKLMQFTDENKKRNIITVGMGLQWGERSRSWLPCLGSRLTYASASPNHQTAIGQPSYKILSMLRNLYLLSN